MSAHGPRNHEMLGDAWVPAIVLALGLVSVLLLWATRWIDHRLIARDQQWLRAVGSVGVTLATSHLWLEEYVTGDQVDLDSILKPLDRAEGSIRGMLDGGGNEGIGPLSDPELRARAVEVDGGIAAFRALTERRLEGYRRGDDVGVGSEFDKRYDAQFAAVFEASAGLSGTLEHHLAGTRRRAELLFRAILGLWVIVVVVALVGLWTLMRHRRAAERALRESRERLLRAQKTEALGRLAGGIAHDVNNYLAAIRGHADLLASTVDHRLHHRVEGIVRVVGKASELIDRLLVSARQQPSGPRVIEPNRMLREGLGPVLERLVQDPVVLRTRLDAAVWPIEVDPIQFEQVVVNLVVNARDAIAGRGHVTLRTENIVVDPGRAERRGPKAGEYVVLSVADDGPGIAPDLRDRIFDPFFTTKGRASHSGLGLSTVLGIVESAGGTVTIDSGSEKGSRFDVWWPRSHKSPARCVGELAKDVSERPSRPKPAALLLVEDNDELRRSLEEILDGAGYTVTAAADAERALTVLRATTTAFDLLVTDVVLPGANGIELAARARKESPDVRVLFMSGHTDDTPAGAALLYKPFSTNELLDAVEDALAPT